MLLSAVGAAVKYLVSEDKDLTEQAASLEPAAVKILLPGVFLREVLGWTGEQLEAIRKRNWQDIEAAS